MATITHRLQLCINAMLLRIRFETIDIFEKFLVAMQEMGIAGIDGHIFARQQTEQAIGMTVVAFGTVAFVVRVLVNA